MNVTPGVTPNKGRRFWEDFEEEKNMDETVTISKKEYESLLDSLKWRICVENAGVDNWDGFYYAMQEYHEGEDD